MANRFLAHSPPPTDNDAAAAIGFNEESSDGAFGTVLSLEVKGTFNL